MTLDAWQRTGRRFTYRTHTIVYHDEGEGEALLCLHGFPTASWDWHKLWPALTQRFRVIAPDLLGFGFSDKPRQHDYSLFTQATLNEVLLQSLGIDEVHVLAHDYGDTVAQELLARYEKRRAQGVAGVRIKSVCLLNGGFFPEAIHPRLIQRLLQSPLGWLVGLLITEEQFRRSFSAIFGLNTLPPEEELAAFWSLITYNDGTRVAHELSRYQHERREHRERWVGALQRTSVPLRFINGVADPVSGADMVSRYHALIPDPDIVVLQDIGHYPQIEAPDSVLQRFLSFVEQHLDT